MLFCDLVASTERVQLVGDDEADRFRRAFFGRMHEAVTATHGELVKNTGDGVMVVFRDSAVSAVTCAATMHDKVEALDVDPPAFVRVGISAGEVAAELGDYFGTPVVEAAGLCAAAEAGQTLVSDVVRVLVGSRGGHAFRSVGALTLKGLTEPLASAALVRTPIVAPKPATAPSPRLADALVVCRGVRRGCADRGRACQLGRGRQAQEGAGRGARGRGRLHATRRACSVRAAVPGGRPQRGVRRTRGARRSRERERPVDPRRVSALSGVANGPVGPDHR